MQFFLYKCASLTREFKEFKNFSEKKNKCTITTFIKHSSLKKFSLFFPTVLNVKNLLESFKCLKEIKVQEKNCPRNAQVAQKHENYMQNPRANSQKKSQSNETKKILPQFLKTLHFLNFKETKTWSYSSLKYLFREN